MERTVLCTMKNQIDLKLFSSNLNSSIIRASTSNGENSTEAEKEEYMGSIRITEINSACQEH